MRAHNCGTNQAGQSAKAPPLPLVGRSRRGPHTRLQHRHPLFASCDGSGTGTSRPSAERDRRLARKEEGGTSAARYLIKAATLMLSAVRVRAASAGGSSDVITAGPRSGVRSAACPPTGSAAPAAACGIPGRGGHAPLARCPCKQEHPRPERVMFRHGLTT